MTHAAGDPALTFNSVTMEEEEEELGRQSTTPTCIYYKVSGRKCLFCYSWPSVGGCRLRFCSNVALGRNLRSAVESYVRTT